MSTATTRRARGVSALAASGLKFLLIGGLATVVTIAVFNLLTHVGSRPLLSQQPILAYGVGLVAGLVVNYLGNRFWAFGSGRPESLWRQIGSFLLVNGVAFAIPAVCLAISRYLLNLDSALADNVSANVVGLVLATLTRWWLYRRIVFPSPR